MRSIRRRAVLQLAGVGAGLSLAGCLASLDDSDPGDSERDLTADENLEAAIFQAGATSSRPRWAEDEGRPGIVATLESAMEAEAFAARPGEDGDVDPDLASWIQETDFEDSVILGVQTAAPNACYEAVAFAGLAISTVDAPMGDGEIEAITGTAKALENADDGAVACAQVLTYPTAYVRVTGDDLPSIAALTITDGWDEKADVYSIDLPIDPESLPDAVWPAGDPPAVPAALECDDEFQRLASADDADVAWGDAVDDDGDDAFAMRVESPDGNHDTDADEGGDAGETLSFERGDGVRITLRNVSNGRQTTGNEHKYNVEVLTEAGWQDVRGTGAGSPVGYTDEGLLHPPGEGFDWDFELTEDGLVEGEEGEQQLRVCPGLQSGRYRFRYWGVPGDTSIAVAFDLEA